MVEPAACCRLRVMAVPAVSCDALPELKALLRTAQRPDPDVVLQAQHRPLLAEGDDPLPDGVYSQADAAVVRYAQRSTRGLAIDASTYGALAEHFSPPQIIDICLNVGLSQITNRFNATFLQEVDEDFTTSNEEAYAGRADGRIPLEARGMKPDRERPNERPPPVGVLRAAYPAAGLRGVRGLDGGPGYAACRRGTGRGADGAPLPAGVAAAADAEPALVTGQRDQQERTFQQAQSRLA
jgi:hypothetical protein